jgi:hypothetical protein
MSRELELLFGRPCDQPGCAVSSDPGMSALVHGPGGHCHGNPLWPTGCALVHGPGVVGRLPPEVGYQLTLTEVGMPSPVIRLTMSHPICASVH